MKETVITWEMNYSVVLQKMQSLCRWEAIYNSCWFLDHNEYYDVQHT